MTEIETLHSFAQRANNFAEIVADGLIPDEHAPEITALVDDLAEAVKVVLDRAQTAEQPILRGILSDLGVARSTLERRGVWMPFFMAAKNPPFRAPRRFRIASDAFFYGLKKPPARFRLIFGADQGWNTRESGKQRQIAYSNAG